MKYSIYFLLLFTLFSAALAADQLTLKNGDVISGQIEKKDGDTVLVKTEFMGEVTIPWSAVTAVKSMSREQIGAVPPTRRVENTKKKRALTKPKHKPSTQKLLSDET